MGQNGSGQGNGQHGQGGSQGGATGFATIYIKSDSKTGPSVTPIHVVEGLTDANYAEVLRSFPQQIKAGDSIVVAAFTMSTTQPAGSSPLNQQRPGMGGGGRGPGR
jgi:hypothetical protein